MAEPIPVNTSMAAGQEARPNEEPRHAPGPPPPPHFPTGPVDTFERVWLLIVIFLPGIISLILKWLATRP